MQRNNTARPCLFASGAFRLRQGKQLRFEFIERHRGVWPVAAMCRVLKVRRGGYYAWRSHRGEHAYRTRRRRRRERMITAAWKKNRRAYGSPRICRAIAKQGERCSVNTVAKYMRRLEIRAKQSRKLRPTTTDSKHNRPIAPNVLNRDFKASRPNEKWVGYLTYVHTDEDWLYVAAVEDLFSRSVPDG